MYIFFRGLCKFIIFIIFRKKVYGAENFNKIEGRCIVCANHKSLTDPVLIACSVKRPINFMAKKEIFKNPILKWLFTGVKAFPVDRQGVTMSAMKHAINLLKEEEILGIFPEGTRVKEYNENNAKPGISMIANMTKSKIVPVYIKSNYKIFGKVQIVFGEPKDYFEGIEGRITTDMHNEIGKKILRDIYSLEERLNDK